MTFRFVNGLITTLSFDARADGDGLYLRYREVDNAPVLFFRFKIAEIEQKITLGNFPGMSLSALGASSSKPGLQKFFATRQED